MSAETSLQNYQELGAKTTHSTPPYLDACAVPPFLRITGVSLWAGPHFGTYDSHGPARSILTLSNDLFSIASHGMVKKQV